VDNPLRFDPKSDQQRARFGIGAKSSLLLALTTILACGAIGFTTYWHFGQTLVDHELRELSLLASVQGERFAAEIDELRADVLFTSRTPVVQRTIRARQAGGIDPVSKEGERSLQQRMAQLFIGLLAAKPFYSQSRLIDAAQPGREVVRVDRIAEDSLSVVPEDQLQNKGQEPYFPAALKLAEGDVYLSDINLNREHGSIASPPNPVIRAATPVFGVDGKPAGFVVINRSIDPLIQTLKAQIAAGSSLLVTNDRGEYLANPDQERTFGFDRGKSYRIQDEFPAIAAAFAPAADRKFSIIGQSTRGERVALGLFRAAFDPSHPERFIAFIVTTPYDNVVAESIHSRNRSVGTASIVLAAAIVGGFLISRSVTKPLREIAAAAAAFGTANPQIAMPVKARDETGVVARALQSMMDQTNERTARLEAEVTERLRAEQLSREHSARTEAILDSASDAIITIDPAGIVESFNRAAERMFRYRASDIIGRNVKLLMPVTYSDEHDQYIRNYVQSGNSKIIGIGREAVGLRSDGTTFPIHLAISDVKVGEKRIFTGIIRDISQLKQTIEQLTETHRALETRASELEQARAAEIEIRLSLEVARQAAVRAEREARDQFAHTQAILDGAIDAIITISSAGIVESFNGAAERMFGYKAADVVGNNIKMLTPPPYYEEHDQYIRNYLHTGVSKVIGIGREVHGLRADGTTFPMHLAVSEVKLGDRRMFTGIVRDITDVKGAMQQLSDAHEELSCRAQQIEAFNVSLTRSNEDLKQFAYVASHDLQEPLRKVTAFCQLLQTEYGDRLDDNARTYINYAVDGAQRMKTLVTDLLTYSRVETQGKPLEPTEADNACAEAVANLDVAIIEAGAQINFDTLPRIMADRVQLVRLFQNLIGNAIKYRGATVPEVHITAEDVGDQWLFRIRDNGIGIDPQYHAKIFVIFQRLHSREEYAGTGIGLAVCKRIVDRAGGRIWVESTAGEGSVFCFTALKPQPVAAVPRFGDRNHDDQRQLVLSATN
jgi:PAS domain S-box-containing protein